jgi:hypothetical protein
MYVAHLGDGYIVKRMPGTGAQHAPDCPSFEPAPDASGLGALLGTAIVENPATGVTTLRLGFAMSKGSREPMSQVCADRHEAKAGGRASLSLLGLLHYLWDQAELTHWRPAFAGKRTWAVVRKHLLRAADGKVAGSMPLQTTLCVPEPFSIEAREAIAERRNNQWAAAMQPDGQRQRLLLMIAEVKQVAPARYGYRVVLKHLPDHAFGLDESLYRRLTRRFATELALWGTDDDTHLISIVTFAVGAAGVPSLNTIALMPTTAQWLPVKDPFENELVDELVRSGRAFVKALKYGGPQKHGDVVATLTDTGSAPVQLLIDAANHQDSEARQHERDGDRWVWRPHLGAWPPVPPRGQSSRMENSPRRVAAQSAPYAKHCISSEK